LKPVTLPICRPRRCSGPSCVTMFPEVANGGPPVSRGAAHRERKSVRHEGQKEEARCHLCTGSESQKTFTTASQSASGKGRTATLSPPDRVRRLSAPSITHRGTSFFARIGNLFRAPSKPHRAFRFGKRGRSGSRDARTGAHKPIPGKATCFGLPRSPGRCRCRTVFAADCGISYGTGKTTSSWGS
jgi:hypothetical protein